MASVRGGSAMPTRPSSRSSRSVAPSAIASTRSPRCASCAAASVAPSEPLAHLGSSASIAPLTYHRPSARRIAICLVAGSNGMTSMRGLVRSMAERRIPRSAAAIRIASSVVSPMPPSPSAASSASQHAAAASSSFAWSVPHSSRTRIEPVVSVPVLSVQITVAQPSVSTAGSLRTST